MEKTLSTLLDHIISLEEAVKNLLSAGTAGDKDSATESANTALAGLKDVHAELTESTANTSGIAAEESGESDE